MQRRRIHGSADTQKADALILRNPCDAPQEIQAELPNLFGELWRLYAESAVLSVHSGSPAKPAGRLCAIPSSSTGMYYVSDYSSLPKLAENGTIDAFIAYEADEAGIFEKYPQLTSMLNMERNIKAA